ncbi:hypothetical protein E2C01_064662 [Portunus trituberculatus]|uniref:Uncharacterized protein n=1 Tax=Portunus trituberculatus TaxID=210409 RepID=A0A5B7HJR0_PORTR|nr:hypothetical protein [Portunus trituberculatus]
MLPMRVRARGGACVNRGAEHRSVWRTIIYVWWRDGEEDGRVNMGGRGREAVSVLYWVTSLETLTQVYGRRITDFNLLTSPLHENNGVPTIPYTTSATPMFPYILHHPLAALLSPVPPVTAAARPPSLSLSPHLTPAVK